MKVVNFGSLNIDYTYRVDDFVRPGETKAALSRSVNCGGKGLNQSVALARAGVNVCHAGFVGPEGGFLVEKLRSCGVDVGFIRTAEENTGHTVIQVSDAGQNCILLYPGTNAILTEAYVDQVLSHCEAGDWVLLQNETNLVGEIIAKASALGLHVALNAAPMDKKVKDYPLEKAEWLFVNETEGAALSGETSYPAIAAALRRRHPNTNLMLTVGADGCLCAAADGLHALGSCSVSPVDTTGAGDTFTGYFLRGILTGQTVPEAMSLASRASAIAVTRPGAADSVPALDEVLCSSLVPRAYALPL